MITVSACAYDHDSFTHRFISKNKILIQMPVTARGNALFPHGLYSLQVSFGWEECTYKCLASSITCFVSQIWQTNQQEPKCDQFQVIELVSHRFQCRLRDRITRYTWWQSPHVNATASQDSENNFDKLRRRNCKYSWDTWKGSARKQSTCYYLSFSRDKSVCNKNNNIIRLATPATNRNISSKTGDSVSCHYNTIVSATTH